MAKEISPATAEQLVNIANQLAFQLGRYAMTPNEQRDPTDAGLVNQIRVAAAGLMAQVDQIARMPQQIGVSTPQPLMRAQTPL